MIISTYKPIGISTHRFVQEIKDSHPDIPHGEKVTHTGSLDPMAEGIVVVLTGEDRFRKQELANVQKTYTFEVLLGVATDSHDLLGLITQVSPGIIKKPDRDFVLKVLSKFTGEINQVMPDFSAKRINGESFFDLARRGEHVPEVSQKVTIHNLNLESIKHVTVNDLETAIPKKIQLVQGDFRQSEVLDSWDAVFKQWRQDGISKLPIAQLIAVTSKRTYIRALVRDISKALHIPATTFSIVRTQNPTN